MEALAGHIAAGMFVLIYGLWWMFISFWVDIRAKLGIPSRAHAPSELCRRSFIPQPCCSKIPLEPMCKIVFPLIEILLTTFIDSYKDTKNKEHLYLTPWNAYEPDGNFTDLSPLHHITIHSCFFLSGVVDLICLFARFPNSTPQLFLSSAFSIQTMLLYIHVENRPALNLKAHQFQAYTTLACAIFSTLRMWKVTNVFINTGLGFWLTVEATWLMQVGVILHGQTYWDQHKFENVMFVTACFGWHVCAVLIFMFTVYFVMTVVLGYCKKQGNFYSPPHNEQAEMLIHNYNHTEMEDFDSSSKSSHTEMSA